MPELPEVQTIVTGLRSMIKGKKIISLREHRSGTVEWRTKNSAFGIILHIDRRGKYIIIATSTKIKFIIHLRMTGKLIFEKNLKKTSSHCRAEFIFSDNSHLLFDDVRTFGKITVMNLSDPVPQLNALGVEPVSEEFTYAYLLSNISDRRIPIKNMLLRQDIIAGLGNIYVLEILFACKIHPQKICRKLSNIEVESIVVQTKRILKQAILKNGTTISDYRSVEDKTGEFQNFLKVYQKSHCDCGTKISRIKMAGRSTFFCPECQKLN